MHAASCYSSRFALCYVHKSALIGQNGFAYDKYIPSRAYEPNNWFEQDEVRKQTAGNFVDCGGILAEQPKKKRCEIIQHFVHLLNAYTSENC